MSNAQIAVFLEQAIGTAFESTLYTVVPSAVAYSTPVVLTKSIFGSAHPKFTDFIAPGIIVR
jgi:hypothetical protein